MNELIHCNQSRINTAGQIVCVSDERLLVGDQGDSTFSRLQKKLVVAFGCAALFFQLCYSVETVNAQGPPEVVQAYGEFPAGYNPQGQIQQVQLPGRAQYYEYLPPRRGWDDRRESPLDRFLKQSFRQTYGRVEYLNWSYSDPGSGFIGASGKKLGSGEGFSSPALIDGTPLQIIGLKDAADGKVLIQTWETYGDGGGTGPNRFEFDDPDGDGIFYDVKDDFVNPNNNINGRLPRNWGTFPRIAGADGVNDDDNDLDIFPRITNAQKERFLTGAETTILFTTGTATNPAQVAVLAVGQLAPLSAFQLDNNNGFRGVFGVDLTFGAMETDFFVMNKSNSSHQFVPIPAGLIGFPGGGGNVGIDPLVIPVTVGGSTAPDVFDSSGNVITDSNNYYLIYNDSYIVDYETEAWGFSQSMFWTLRERPDRFKVSSSLGFRYFDFREQMIQRGSYINEAPVPNTFNTFTYNSELGNDPVVSDIFYNSQQGNALTSTIDSVTKNHVYGPTAGIRARVGDEQFSFGVDTKVMLGLNTHEATVSVDDLLSGPIPNDPLSVGDDRFTEDKGTEFSPGFELVADAKVKVAEHVTLTVGYNFLWFGDVTRPGDNIQYDITAVRVPNPPPLGGPDYTVRNNVIVNKKKTSISLSGISVGVLIDW